MFRRAGAIVGGRWHYGIVSYTSQRRSREMAIRMALGAQQKEVIWMMVREGLLLGLLSAALEIAIARRAACYFTARRVAKVEPLEILRYE